MTRKFTDEEKADAIKKFEEMRAGGTKIRDIEQQLGIGNATIYGWIGQQNKQAKKAARKAAHKGERTQYPIAFKQKAIEMVKSGMTPAAVSREMEVGPSQISYWVKHGAGGRGKEDAQLPAVVKAKPVNGIGSGGAITDALIYLRHAEQEIMDMVRDAKISRPDQAHLLTLLALGCLQKAIAK